MNDEHTLEVVEGLELSSALSTAYVRTLSAATDCKQQKVSTQFKYIVA